MAGQRTKTILVRLLWLEADQLKGHFYEHEKEFVDHFAFVGAISSDYLCSSVRTGGSAANHCGASGASTRTSLCVDRWVSPLEWNALCLGSGALRYAASARRGLGPGSLGAAKRGMGICRRTLALRGECDDLQCELQSEQSRSAQTIRWSGEPPDGCGIQLVA